MSWKEEYLERYKKLKAQGKPFFPHAVFKDTLVAFLILLALLWLSHQFGAGLEDPADPTDSNYNPRPEWYFLFLFQALKLFPGNLESVAAFAVPTVAVGLLFLVPFLDRGPERHPFQRPFFTLLGLAALGGVSYLTYLGAVSPLTNPIVEKDPVVAAGQRLYMNLKCAYCHQIGGKGGTVGPALDRVAGGESEGWLEKHFREPQSVSPGSPMPKLNLLEDEIRSLVAYMKSLGGGGYSPEALSLFSQNCAACHKVGGEGGDSGPDLSLIGAARDKAYIKKYIQDPTWSNPTATMPGFKNELTDVQMEDLARFLASQREEASKKPADRASEKVRPDR